MANNFKTLRQIVGHKALFIGKGWSWILRRPQSTLDVAGKDYATCSLSREIIQEAMPLILSNGKKRAKIFPTNIWKLREYIYGISLFSHIIKSQVHHQYKYTIFYAIAKWKVCIMCMFGMILCTFWGWYTLSISIIYFKVLIHFCLKAIEKYSWTSLFWTPISWKP